MLELLNRLRGPSPQSQFGYQKGICKGTLTPDDCDNRDPADVQKDVETLGERRRCAAILADKNSAEKQAAEAADAELAKAQKALADDPFFKMLTVYEQRQRDVESAKVRAVTARNFHSTQLSQARNFLFRTAAKWIDTKASGFGGEINNLAHARDRVALKDAELKRRAECEALVATLPAKIEAAPLDERPVMLAHLAAARSDLKQFAKRQAEVDRITTEIAKIERKQAANDAERMVAENMQFRSIPKNDS